MEIDTTVIKEILAQIETETQKALSTKIGIFVAYERSPNILAIIDLGKSGANFDKLKSEVKRVTRSRSTLFLQVNHLYIKEATKTLTEKQKKQEKKTLEKELNKSTKTIWDLLLKLKKELEKI